MAPETKSKKRKAIVPNDEVAKVKKVKQMTSETLPKKRKAIDDEEIASNKKSKASKLDSAAGSQAKKTKESSLRNRDVSDLNGSNSAIKNSKVPKHASVTGNAVPDLNGPGNSTEVKSNPSKVKKLKVTQDILAIVDENGSEGESEEEEIDDQTKALLRGFDSDDDNEKDPESEGYEAGEEIPKIDKKILKKSKAAAKASTGDEPGIVYVGRIPHGFYEQEMRQYFSQFGDISNLRLSRNRKTGSSKHYAFIEFNSADVAEIVSKTMDNYLLFGHILKCKLVAKEQIHKNLWLGANKRFKKVPWNKLEGRKLEQGATEEKWDKLNEKEEARRERKKALMNQMDYDFKSPKLKSAKDILKKKQALRVAAITNESNKSNNDDTEPKMIEALGKLQTSAAVKKNNAKKANSERAKESLSEVAEKTEDSAFVVEAPSKKKNAKKGHKRQLTENPESMSEIKDNSDGARLTDVSSKVEKVEYVEEAEKVEKAKKSKKTKQKST